MVGWAVCEDIDLYNRVHALLTSSSVKNNRGMDDVMVFLEMWDSQPAYPIVLNERGRI